MNFETTKVLTKNQRSVTLRMASVNEAQELLNAMVEIAETSPYVLSSPEHFKNMSLEDEIKWINSYNDDPRAVLVVAEFDNKIVGILDFKSYKNIKSRHRGGFGISLHHTIRGEGLGELLFKKLISEVKKISDLIMIELSLMSDNHQAYHLYKKVGFVEVGRKPMAYKQPDGRFNDDVQMVLKL